MSKLNPHKNRTKFKDKIFYVVEHHDGGLWYFSHSPTVGDFRKLDPDYDPSGDVTDLNDIFSVSELTFRS